MADTQLTVKDGSNSLAEIAHAINVRLQKADDHRLAASLKLAEACAICQQSGISFKEWVTMNIKFIGYKEASKLAKIGASEDPPKALADLREATRASRRKSYAGETSRLRKRLPEPEAPAPRRGPEVVAARVREAISNLTGLPSAAEVVGYLRGTNDGIIVGERIQTAADWLAEFAEEWSATDA